MATIFAAHQSSDFKNFVENVAIVGAGGRSGSFIAKALIQKGNHRVTAITRPDSTSEMPEGLHSIEKVDYSDRDSLVNALKGQDVLIITMSRFSGSGSQAKLIDAAVEAGVRWIMPNEWGIDLAKPKMAKDVLIAEEPLSIRKYIETVGAGKTHWIGLCCGFWYEFSLAGTDASYGFELDKKSVTFIDDGTVKMNTTTWPQVGRAVANLLSLKVIPEDENDKSHHLSLWKDKSAHISSFFASQKDMFGSVLKVTGDNREDWKITHENSVERFERGKGLHKDGHAVGLRLLMYTRLFYNDGSGDFNEKLDNEILGLPTEDFDEATKVAIDMSHNGFTEAVRKLQGPYTN